MGNFHPLEVVGRGSETQLLVGEKVKKDKVEGLWKKQNLLSILLCFDQDKLQFSLNISLEYFTPKSQIFFHRISGIF